MPKHQSTTSSEEGLPPFAEPDPETGEPTIQVVKLPDDLFDRILDLTETGFTPEWYRMHNKVSSLRFNRIEAAEGNEEVARMLEDDASNRIPMPSNWAQFVEEPTQATVEATPTQHQQ